MKAYLAITAALFGLLTGLHIWRIIVESRLLAREPSFMFITVLSAALCGWAITLLLSSRAADRSA
jgi:uncharacterized membrane protein YqjE